MLRRKKKKVLLTTVEEPSEPADVVIRLGAEKEWEDNRPPVRIGPAKVVVEASTAEAPSRDFRSHQPDIDDLIDNSVRIIDEDAEQKWGEEAHTRPQRPWGWFLLVGLFIAGMVAWSLHALKVAEPVKQTIRVKSDEAIVDEAAEQSEAEAFVNSIESAIRSYFTASTIESRLSKVRFPERIEPMMRQHEKIYPVTPSLLHTIRILQPLPIGNFTHFWMASVVLDSGERHELIIESTKAGPRIDWETLVCYQPMRWDEFVSKRPTETSMDFRVYVRPDTFYSHEFHDETVWACYRLSAPDAEEVMFGYVRRGSEAEAEIAPLTNGIRHASLILRLQIPPGLQSPMGVVIDKVLSPRWLYVTSPDQED